MDAQKRNLFILTQQTGALSHFADRALNPPRSRNSHRPELTHCTTDKAWEKYYTCNTRSGELGRGCRQLF
jgi:hypothetical protein